MHKLKNYILCVIISVIMVFAILIAEAVIFTNTSVFSSEIYKSALTENDVYSKINTEFEKHYNTEENITGVPSNVYMDFLDNDTIKKIADGCIDDTFLYINNQKSQFEFDIAKSVLRKLKDKTDSFYDKYAESMNYIKDDSYYEKTESAFEAASSYIIDTADVFQFSTIEEAGYLKYAVVISKYSSILSVVAVVLVLILMCILALANRGYISNLFYWIGLSSGISSLLFLVLGIYIRQTEFFNKFAIKTTYIFSAVTGTFYKMTDKIIFINAIIFVISIILIFIFSLIVHKKKQ